MQQNGETQRYAFLVTRVAASRPRRPNGPGSSGARRRRCNVKSAGQACFEEEILAPDLDRSWMPSDHHGAATPPIAGTKIPHLSCGADTAASPIVEGDRPALEDPTGFQRAVLRCIGLARDPCRVDQMSKPYVSSDDMENLGSLRVLTMYPAFRRDGILWEKALAGTRGGPWRVTDLEHLPLNSCSPHFHGRTCNSYPRQIQGRDLSLDGCSPVCTYSVQVKSWVSRF